MSSETGRPGATADTGTTPGGGDGVAGLLRALGVAAGPPAFVARASTSTVWRVQSDRGPLAVRILSPRPGKPTRLAGEVAPRHRLTGIGQPVAEPLFHHDTRPDIRVPEGATGWAVDRWIEGGATGPDTPDAVWHDLGAVLATLHRLPASRSGRLEAPDGSDPARLAGRCRTPAEGIADRFDDPWPFAGAALEEHPVARDGAVLVPRLRALEPAIRAAADGPPAIVHGDLNGKNIRQSGGRLAGLIDFTDAAVLTACWDFALLRHFHGDRTVARVLDGYAPGAGSVERMVTGSRLLALVVALHHLSRARTLDLPRRRDYALGRLRQGLDAIDAG